MQRILDPAQIEAFTERSIPRVRLPDPPSLFAQRAQRLRALAENHSLSGYLRLMATVADAQRAELDALRPALLSEQFAASVGSQIEVAHAHRMPVLQAATQPSHGWSHHDRWHTILKALCTAVGSVPGFPAAVHLICERLVIAPRAELETQADLLIAARSHGVDAPAAPFVMAALQVCWAGMASTLQVSDVPQLDVPTVCPVCGSLPVASVVRSDKRSPQGYRYLHCGLCATEWHMVRITCSHCLTTEGITYHSIEGGSAAVRAETCSKCHTYRKILYQEKDTEVEPVADDLSSLALDLLMTEEGFHRGSGNPLLWQNTET
jgi:FdhE protein